MTERVLTRRTAERLVEAASAAPSMHNSQPWRFVVRTAERVVEIYADPARTLRRGDPQGRAVHIACGAALFNLRLAVTHAGAEPVARLLPDPRNPMLLASVRFGGARRPGQAEQELYEAIERRPATRPPLPHRGVPSHVLAALAEAATAEGAHLRTLAQPDVWRILQLTAAADHLLRSDPEYLAELASRAGDRCQRLPAAMPGQPSRPRPVAAVPPAHDVAARPRPRAAPREPKPAAAGHAARLVTAPSPQILVVCTDSDDRASWLRAGQAMQRVLLLATHRGLRVSPLAPVLEVPDTPLRGDPAFAGEWPEMILRAGYGPPVMPSPRRPARQTLRIIGAPVPAADTSRAGPHPALVPG